MSEPQKLTCGRCAAEVRLRKDGRIATHKWHRLNMRCSWSKRKPAEINSRTGMIEDVFPLEPEPSGEEIAREMEG